jgi:N-acetyl sugar amidotransferase
MKLKAFYGLPNKVRFCKKTLISNQRPNSELEFKHNIKTKKKTINIDKNGLSDAWKYSLEKKKIDYKKREIKLLRLLDKHRGKHGKYDCVVPGSGGKDSCYASHILKFKYGMNPLTVTWPPIMYTTYGYKNFKNWLKTGNLDNITGKRNKKLMSFLTSSSIKNLLHPFQTFILGQKIFPIKVALKHKIPLVFYGDNEAEHGNPIADNATSLRNKSFHTLKDKDEIYLGGIQYRNLVDKYKFNPKDLDVFLPPSQKLFDETNIEVRYLGYYLKWVPQEVFYYSVKNCGFIPRPFRSAGTYSKYSGIDDKIDDLHFYTTYIKFGIGRATYDVAQELRNGHLSIEEGKRLIKKYDGEFPDRYFLEIMKYLNFDPEEFLQLVDKFRSPHLWKKTKKKWMLRYTSY